MIWHATRVGAANVANMLLYGTEPSLNQFRDYRLDEYSAGAKCAP